MKEIISRRNSLLSLLFPLARTTIMPGSEEQHNRVFDSTVISCSTFQSWGWWCTKGKGKVNRCSGIKVLSGYLSLLLVWIAPGVNKTNENEWRLVAIQPPVPLAASKQPVITHDPKEPWAGTGRQGKDMKEIISRRNSLLSLLFPLARPVLPWHTVPSPGPWSWPTDTRQPFIRLKIGFLYPCVRVQNE
jgi:hypothetical protein